MDVLEAIQNRRSIKKFTDRAVERADIERLLSAAVLAPNHKMTQPWEFIVLGPAARRAYGYALGARKAQKVEDPEAARLVREKIADEHAALPAMIAATVPIEENPETREEDYAATMMAIQNLSLVALAIGLGTHIKTGAVMDDPAARAAAGVAEGRRIIAIINIGEPAEIPAGKERAPASSRTRWLD